MHDLIRAWRQLDHSPGQSYILPSDIPIMHPSHTVFYRSLQLYKRRNKANDKANGRLYQIGLLPVPYVGRITTASVFLLLNNAGLSPNDYNAELGFPDIRDYLLKNLRQNLGRERYPFICLNPAFSMHPGFGYWEAKFRFLVGQLIAECGIDIDTAISFISKQVACLQLVPYHSSELRARLCS